MIDRFGVRFLALVFQLLCITVVLLADLIALRHSNHALQHFHLGLGAHTIQELGASALHGISNAAHGHGGCLVGLGGLLGSGGHPGTAGGVGLALLAKRLTGAGIQLIGHLAQALGGALAAVILEGVALGLSLLLHG